MVHSLLEGDRAGAYSTELPSGVVEVRLDRPGQAYLVGQAIAKIQGTLQAGPVTGD
jgi:hypothetical protein